MGFFSGKSKADRAYEKALSDYQRSRVKRGEAKTHRDKALMARVNSTGGRLSERREREVYERHSMSSRNARKANKRYIDERIRVMNDYRRKHGLL